MVLYAPLGVLKPIEDISRIQRIMKQCHDALRVEKPHFLDAFDELSKIILAKLMDEIEFSEGHTEQHRFSAQTDIESLVLTINGLFSRACERYESIFPPGTQIQLKPTTISNVVQILKPYSLVSTSVDVKGGAYEAFLKSALPVGKVIGQFFTPTQIVDFAVGMVSPGSQDRVVDPALGTGGFLLSTARHLLMNGNIHGNYQLQLIGSDIDPRMVRLAKLNMLLYNNKMLMNGHLTIGIFHQNGLVDVSTNPLISRGSFQVALTNPPFGSRETDPGVLGLFESARGSKGVSTPVLFLERCLELLAPGGLMAIVLPESILANPSMRTIRELVGHRSIVLALVKLPSEAFLPYGSTAESSLVFLKRKTDPREPQGPIFMAEARSVGYNRLGEQTVENDLPSILSEYQNYRTLGRVDNSSREGISFAIDAPGPGERLDVRYYFHPELDETNKLLAQLPCPVKELGQVVHFRKEVVNPSADFPKGQFRYIGLGNVQSETDKLVYRDATRHSRDRMRIHRELVGGSDIGGSVLRVKSGDILFAKLRPYLRKVFIVPEFGDCVCSTEFLVMYSRQDVDPQYLRHMLASDLVLKQLQHQYTGIGRPRVTQKMVSKVRIPVPGKKVQARAVEIMNSYSNRVATLMAEISKLGKDIIDLRDGARKDVLDFVKQAN